MTTTIIAILLLLASSAFVVCAIKRFNKDTAKTTMLFVSVFVFQLALSVFFAVYLHE